MDDGTIDYRQIAQLKAQEDLPQVSAEQVSELLRRASPHLTRERPKQERTRAIVELVGLYAAIDRLGAQTRVAELLGVTRTVISRHMTKARGWAEEQTLNP